MEMNGWFKGYNMEKFHYMVDGKSLCKKWMTFSGDLDPDTDGPAQKDDCKTCYKKRQEMKAKAVSN